MTRGTGKQRGEDLRCSSRGLADYLFTPNLIDITPNPHLDISYDSQKQNNDKVCLNRKLQLYKKIYDQNPTILMFKYNIMKSIHPYPFGKFNKIKL